MANGAFWIALIFASAFGAQSVASGFPRLLGLFVPPGTMSAEARMTPAVSTIRMALPPEGTVTPEIRSTVDNDDVVARPVAAAAAPAIAIVIDDLGADAVHTREAIALPREVALSFLPYPEDTPTLARDARRAGHEILVHVPMEAVGAHDPGPSALATGMAPDEILRRLEWALSRVPGYAGINNHEGSRFTADRGGLALVMQRLSGRHVFFLDSRTTPDSQVLPVARVYGVASAARDVFLDDVATIDAVDQQLHALETRARAQGAAIAIGHPREITLDAVAYWAGHRPGLRLVPLSEAIRLKMQRDGQTSLALAGG